MADLGGVVVPGVVGEGSGFNFDLCKRNQHLAQKGVKQPIATKTGTTIAGVVFKGGVVLGADTRSTAGTVVADKNCEKIHFIADNIYCCGAGTAADTAHVTEMVASHLKLHQYATGRPSKVITALTLLKQHLFKYQGHISAALVLGGYDFNGPHLFTVFPHGSVDSLPFATMGSGSLNAMAVFESGYKDDMTQEEAEILVARAIKYGVYNDLGSGSNIDLTVITKGKVEIKRNLEYLQDRLFTRQFPVDFKARPAPVIKAKNMLSLSDVVIEDGEPEAMDTS